MFVILKESELHHSIGSLIDGAHPSPRTDRDYIGRYCLKTFETFLVCLLSFHEKQMCINA